MKGLSPWKELLWKGPTCYLLDADLERADLRKVILKGADLRGARLNGADLSGARGVTNQQLDWQARSLAGATMPDGHKYAGWLRTKD